jgi:hypothetical protein
MKCTERAYSRPRNRHHRGIASVTGGGSVERLALQKSWRSPEGGDTLGCVRTRKSPPQQETAHGEVYRAGCPCVKLHDE